MVVRDGDGEQPPSGDLLDFVVDILFLTDLNILFIVPATPLLPSSPVALALFPFTNRIPNASSHIPCNLISLQKSAKKKNQRRRHRTQAGGSGWRRPGGKSPSTSQFTRPQTASTSRSLIVLCYQTTVEAVVEFQELRRHVSSPTQQSRVAQEVYSRRNEVQGGGVAQRNTNSRIHR